MKKYILKLNCTRKKNSSAFGFSLSLQVDTWTPLAVGCSAFWTAQIHVSARQMACACIEV